MTGNPRQTGSQTPDLPQVDQGALDLVTAQKPRLTRRYETHYAPMGNGYNEYRRAYRYGYELAVDARCNSMDWSTLELQAHRGWDAPRWAGGML